jgi:amino acid adenylation domain-containing protein
MAEPVHEIVERGAAATPDRPAIVSDECTLTYAELALEVRRAAAWLRDNGVRRHDRVLIVLGNRVEIVTAMFAASRLGAAFVILNDTVKPYHLRHVVEDAAPAVILAGDRAADVREVAGDTPLLTLARYAAEVPACAPLDRGFAGITSDVVSLIYTSGSTAKPKGVVSTHRNVRFAAEAIGARLGIEADDVVGVFLPLSFDYGLYQVHLALQAGATLAIGHAGHMGPGLVRKLCAWGVTVLPLMPSIATTLLRLLARDPGRERPPLRSVTNTGAELSPRVVDELHAALPGCAVFVMFGLTECKRVSILEPADFERKRGSVGAPLHDTECFVVDDDGQPVPPGTVGELVVRGPHVMSGYWRAPELTAKRFRRCGDSLEVVLFTGDRCALDEDGFLYFHGRDDDIYKARGFRVSALEVEDVASSLPGVREAAVVVPRNGEDPMLFITGEADPPSIVSRLRERLEDYKVPAQVVRIKRMPLNVNGKIDKRALAPEPMR